MCTQKRYCQLQQNITNKAVLQLSRTFGRCTFSVAGPMVQWVLGNSTCLK